jgi:SAM-dependent methyltransferase
MHDHDHDAPHGASQGAMLRRPREPKRGRRGVSPTFQAFVEAHDWKGKSVVDLGCGTGAGTVMAAKLGASALGIDLDAEVLIAAKERAAEAKAHRARFLCADVEMADYADLAGGPVDGVLAHLCFSDEIARRAGKALKPGGLFFIRAFESDMWKEAGSASDFAYSAEAMRKLLASAGFKVNKLKVERRVQTFDSFPHFEESMLWDAHRRAMWEESGRLETLRRGFKRGNRDLTEAFLLVEAVRKAPPARRGAKAKGGR